MLKDKTLPVHLFSTLQKLRSQPQAAVLARKSHLLGQFSIQCQYLIEGRFMLYSHRRAHSRETCQLPVMLSCSALPLVFSQQHVLQQQLPRNQSANCAGENKGENEGKGEEVR